MHNLAKSLKIKNIIFVFVLACSNLAYGQSNFAGIQNINRLNIELGINEYPSCFTPYNSYGLVIAGVKPMHIISAGCPDLHQGILGIILKNRVLMPAISLNMSNRISFANLGGNLAHHKLMYLSSNISYTSMFDAMYAGNLGMVNAVGFVFPISVSNAQAYKDAGLFDKSESKIDFNIILELGLGFNYAFYAGAAKDKYKKSEEYHVASIIALSPTFSLLYNLRSQYTPNFEFESGIRIKNGLMFDIPLRMQYDFSPKAAKTKFGISGELDLWSLSLSLGLGMRY